MSGEDPGWERYRRQLELEGFGAAGQRALARATVTVFGLGGLGSAVTSYLAAAGVGRLILVDRDRVELSNLNRQILYDGADVGGSKVSLAAERLTRLNDRVAIEAHEVEITIESAGRLAAAADVIVDALDIVRTAFDPECPVCALEGRAQ